MTTTFAPKAPKAAGMAPAHWFKLTGLLVVSLLLFGCPANKPSDSSSGASPASDGNQVVIRGSNTIGEELAPGLIAEFKKEHAAIKFDLETKATGYGIAALRAGQCNIAAASRAIIAEELELNQTKGVEMSDQVIGAYSVAVVVQASNPIINLTKEQVHGIFTGAILNWKDVGGPDAAITLYLRDPISGTHLGFKEIAMKNDSYGHNPKLFTNYNGIVTALAADPHGIGYSSIALATTGGTKSVSIDGVAASTANVHSGKYPYARMLRLYTIKARETQPTRDFIQFVLSSRGQETLTQMGYTPKP